MENNNKGYIDFETVANSMIHGHEITKEGCLTNCSFGNFMINIRYQIEDEVMAMISIVYDMENEYNPSFDKVTPIEKKYINELEKFINNYKNETQDFIDLGKYVFVLFPSVAENKMDEEYKQSWEKYANKLHHKIIFDIPSHIKYFKEILSYIKNNLTVK